MLREYPERRRLSQTNKEMPAKNVGKRRLLARIIYHHNRVGYRQGTWQSLWLSCVHQSPGSVVSVHFSPKPAYIGVNDKPLTLRLITAQYE